MTGAERYLEGRLADDEYRAAYEAAQAAYNEACEVFDTMRRARAKAFRGDDFSEICEIEGHPEYGADYLDGVELVGRCWCGKAIYPR